MAAFRSRVDPQSTAFLSNREDMLQRVRELREIESRAAALSEKRREVFEQRGQLTPRERLARLLDPGMPFLELYNLANYLVDDPDPGTSIPGASALVGIGFVSGVRCMVMVADSGISAGAMKKKSLDKALGALKVALRQKLPFIHLVESAGANLMEYEVELWAAGGGMFHGLARSGAYYQR